MRKVLTYTERRDKHTDSSDPAACWEWGGHRDRDGYGAVRFEGTTRSAHRAAYITAVGPIPDGLQIDHLCRNTACVNPAHLEPVTPAENTRRSTSLAGINARKTHCKRGHEFTPENTMIAPQGHRRCRACNRLKWARYKARKQAAAADSRSVGSDPIRRALTGAA